MTVVVDATTLLALGAVGELERLRSLSGDLVTTPVVRAEVTTEPEATNLDRFIAAGHLEEATPTEHWCEKARVILGDDDRNGDVEILAHVLARTDENNDVGVVSDDKRVRTTAEGFGATVTGTIGVLVRSVAEGHDPEDTKRLVRQLDDHGLHMTATLVEKADELIDSAVDR